MAARTPPSPDVFRLRRLEKPEEFRHVEDVERRAWGLSDEPPVPASLERAFQDHGGLVLGAYADVHLAGFSVGFLGWDGERLYHYSHLTGVRPEYRNHHLGLRLKLFQREEVLKQGLDEIRWTFDPLQSRNAQLFLRRLGARPNGYKVHYYGQRSNALDQGLETDRLRVVWSLRAPEVEARLSGRFPSAADDAARHARSSAIVTTAASESGLRLPTEVAEPEGPSAHLEVPFDIDLIRTHEPEALRRWRHAVRDAFRAAFDLGYVIDDFATVPVEHERRSFYLLSPGERSSPTAAAGSG